jgi:peptide/nickel transport system permease protein
MNMARVTTFALLALMAIHGAAALADFLAPYSFAAQQREFSFTSPARLHWIDRRGVFHLRPFVYAGAEATFQSRDRQGAAQSKECFVRFLTRGFHYRLLGILPADRHLFGVDAPGFVFLLGTDEFGRDQLSRLLYGSRNSLAAAWLATLFSLAIGMVVGAFSGFHGGWVDDVLMRMAEASLSLPWLYLLLAGRALLPLSFPPASAYLMLMGLVGVLGWARPARLIRAVALSARERTYVLAAKAFGASDWYLVRAHVLPAVFGVAITQAALLAPRYLMAEVTLSFLGLGVEEPLPSWGNMLTGVQHYYILASYWWMLLPALAPAAVSVCCSVLSDSLIARHRPAPL